MLLIDGREFKVTEETAFLGNISYNKFNGYNRGERLCRSQPYLPDIKQKGG